MIGLGNNLSAVGISAAKGIDLAMRREQIDASLPGDANGGSRNRQSTASGKAHASAKAELTAAQQRQVEALKSADVRVRAHEQAHLAAGAGIVSSGASYTYTYGPDGRAYATAGEVGIDTSAEKKPQENIDKGRLIQAAALAPPDPSPQDRRVAAVGAIASLRRNRRNRAPPIAKSRGGRRRNPVATRRRLPRKAAPTRHAASWKMPTPW